MRFYDSKCRSRTVVVYCMDEHVQVATHTASRSDQSTAYAPSTAGSKWNNQNTTNSPEIHSLCVVCSCRCRGNSTFHGPPAFSPKRGLTLPPAAKTVHIQRHGLSSPLLSSPKSKVISHGTRCRPRFRPCLVLIDSSWRGKKVSNFHIINLAGKPNPTLLLVLPAAALDGWDMLAHGSLRWHVKTG
jgi:hypothetical protein